MERSRSVSLFLKKKLKMTNEFPSYFIEIIQKDKLKEFTGNLKYNPTLITRYCDGLNVYQICCVLGSVSILSYLDEEGYSSLGDELDDEVLF